jgi:hypothetical protein
VQLPCPFLPWQRDTADHAFASLIVVPFLFFILFYCFSSDVVLAFSSSFLCLPLAAFGSCRLSSWLGVPSSLLLAAQIAIARPTHFPFFCSSWNCEAVRPTKPLALGVYDCDCDLWNHVKKKSCEVQCPAPIASNAIANASGIVRRNVVCRARRGRKGLWLSCGSDVRKFDNKIDGNISLVQKRAKLGKVR